MDNLKRGYSFLMQAWQMAKADPDLVKPSVYSLLAGLIVTVLFLPLIILSGMNLADRVFGQVLTGFLGVLLVFAQLAIGYIFSAMTVHLVYSYLTDGDGDLQKAWQIVRRDWLDILSLAAVSSVVRLFRQNAQKKGKSTLAGAAGGTIEAIWTEASYLVLPAMVIEDFNLKDGILRVVQILRENLLLIGISWVGVRLINGLISFVLGAAGILCGLGIGLGIASLARGATLAVIISIVLGVLVASLFSMAAIVINNYTSTAYHTCLYLWTREVERARQLGHSSESVLAPAPLAAALQEPVPA